MATDVATGAATGASTDAKIDPQDRDTAVVDCDLVLEMEEAGVGVEEIIQYARGALSDAEIDALIRGLERILDITAADPGDDAGAGDTGGSGDADGIVAAGSTVVLPAAGGTREAVPEPALRVEMREHALF